jgi:hypothetical protein
MAMKIKKNETKIADHWISDGSKIMADETCKRPAPLLLA